MNLSNLSLKKYPVTKFRFLRYFIGDVRDAERLDIALKGLISFHAAALNKSILQNIIQLNVSKRILMDLKTSFIRQLKMV